MGTYSITLINQSRVKEKISPLRDMGIPKQLGNTAAEVGPLAKQKNLTLSLYNPSFDQHASVG